MVSKSCSKGFARYGYDGFGCIKEMKSWQELWPLQSERKDAFARMVASAVVAVGSWLKQADVSSFWAT